MTDEVRVRFAPSPTGHLHIGGARTAIYNWAFARKMGGKFILRIEDTDPERSTEANTQAILNAMDWLGLDYDEGPGVGGDYGPYFQTQRMDTYKEALELMRERDAVYPCFCTAAEIAAKRVKAEEEHGGYDGYDGTCRDIPVEEANARIAAGEPHCWRLKVPKDHPDIEFDDVVRGHCTFPISSVDDLIVVRTDGSPTYNFAVVCDDANMKMTHILRGDDHLSNTPKQILIYEALGLTPPQFGHLAMIWGPDGKRLSKRHGATSVEEYRAQGFLPDAMVNYLALLGWSLDGETTVIDRETLKREFALDHISKNPAIFDNEKLSWLNGVYLRDMPEDAFCTLLGEKLEEEGLCSKADFLADDARAKLIRSLIFERVKHTTEMAPMVAYLFGDDVALDEKSVEKVLAKEGAREALDACAEMLADESLEWKTEVLEEALRTLPEKLDMKAKKIFQPLRVAVCGNMVSPPLFESIELLGRECVLKRIESAKGSCL